MRATPATPVTFSHCKYGQPLAVDASSFPNWTGIVRDREPHVLDFHEFLIVSAGAAEVSIGDRLSRVTGPAVVFTPPGLVRRVEIVEPLTLDLVVFSNDALRGTIWPRVRDAFTAGSMRVRSADSLAPLNAVAQLIGAELSAPKPDSAAMLDALLAQFLIALNRARAGSAIEAPALLRRFERLLDSRFRDHHAVAPYAAALGVSADYLSAVARSHRGLSAKALIERRLFAEATRLLVATPLSIAAIGWSLGFDEPSQFSRAFKRACGQSPRRFRAGC
jgi:AraC family transcriptional activator of pobA